MVKRKRVWGEGGIAAAAVAVEGTGQRQLQALRTAKPNVEV